MEFPFDFDQRAIVGRPKSTPTPKPQRSNPFHPRPCHLAVHSLRPSSIHCTIPSLVSSSESAPSAHRSRSAARLRTGERVLSASKSRGLYSGCERPLKPLGRKSSPYKKPGKICSMVDRRLQRGFLQG